jgi:hypothetical protein
MQLIEEDGLADIPVRGKLPAVQSHSDRLIATLPPAVAAFIRSTNAGDLDTLLSIFVTDALVNDQLRDYRGTEAIADWAERDIIGERISLEIVDTLDHYGHSIVRAHIDGLFDKRGLPNPLVLSFYFSSHDDKIVQLIILRNQAGID